MDYYLISKNKSRRRFATFAEADNARQGHERAYYGTDYAVVMDCSRKTDTCVTSPPNTLEWPRDAGAGIGKSARVQQEGDKVSFADDTYPNTFEGGTPEYTLFNKLVGLIEAQCYARHSLEVAKDAHDVASNKVTAYRKALKTLTGKKSPI